jgi:hypothetical protein
MSDRLWTELETEVLDGLLHGTKQALSAPCSLSRPGIYALFFARTPRLRCLQHPGLSNGRWPCYVGVADRSIAARLTEHRLGLIPVEGLSSSTFSVITLELPSPAAAAFAERSVIGHLRPVYNEVLKGLASKPQGRQRADQARSPFSVLHPGRPGPTGPANVSAAELRVKVRSHLEATVPAIGGWPPN